MNCRFFAGNNRSISVLLALAFVASIAPASAQTVQFDQDVTPAVIVGTGIGNGAFTVDRRNGIELGLRGKLRFNEDGQPENTFNSNGDGTYSFSSGVAPTEGSPTPEWSFEFSINTDFDGGSGKNLSELEYEIGLDGDPTAGTDFLVFDPVIPADETQFFDHAIGTNQTGAGGGNVATDAQTYTTLIESNNVAQNSWRYDFFQDTALASFDPNDQGRYTVFLRAIDPGSGDELARTEIVILVDEPELSLSVERGLPDPAIPEQDGWANFTATLTNTGGPVPENIVLWVEVDGLTDADSLEGLEIQHFTESGQWQRLEWAGPSSSWSLNRDAWFLGQGTPTVVGFEIPAGIEFEIPMRVNFPNGIYSATASIESLDSADGSGEPGDRIYLQQTEALAVRSMAVPIAYVDDDFAGTSPGTTVDFPRADGSTVSAIYGIDAFSTLQAGEAAVEMNGEVLVAPGTYSVGSEGAAQGIVIDVAGVTVRSTEGAATTIIDGSGSDNAVWIGALGADGPHPANIRIEGFTIQNWQLRAIVQRHGDQPTEIVDNIAVATDLGARNAIQISGGDGSLIRGNRVDTTSFNQQDWNGTAILVSGARNAEISDNDVSGADVGIAILGGFGSIDPAWAVAEGNLIAGNVVSNNTEAGIELQGDVRGTRIENNQSTNNRLGISTTDAGGFFPSSPTNTGIEGNTIEGNQTGVRFFPPTAGLDDVGTNQVLNNVFTENTVQVRDADFAHLDFEAVLAGNTFDRAVVVRENPIVVPKVFSSIQDAIDGALENQTVEVHPGTYPEAPFIDKSLTLVSSAGAAETEIDAGGLTNAVSIGTIAGSFDADTGIHPTFARIEGFTVTGWTDRGIAQRLGTGTVEVVGNRVFASQGGTRAGILIAGGSESLISDNVVEAEIFLAEGFDGAGILAVGSVNATIENNTVSGGDIGIAVAGGFGTTDPGWEVAQGVVIQNNQIRNLATGIDLQSNVQNTSIRSNDIEDAGGRAISMSSFDGSGIFASGVLIQDNTATAFGSRAFSSGSNPATDIEIRNNTFTSTVDGSRGIQLGDGSSDALITGNRVEVPVAAVNLRPVSNLVLENNVLIGGEAGITARGQGHATNQVTGNQITGGVVLLQEANTDGFVLRGNRLPGLTGDRGIEISGDATIAGPLDAKCNWWGDATGPSGIAGGSGTAVSPNVTFVPWNTGEDGPCTGGLALDLIVVRDVPDAPGILLEEGWDHFSVRLVNSGADVPYPVRIFSQIENTGGQVVTPADGDFQFWNATESRWDPLAWIEQEQRWAFGPADGFSVPSGWDVTTPVRVSFEDGGYQITNEVATPDLSQVFLQVTDPVTIQRAASVLAIDPVSHDFGQVEIGSQGVFAFTVRNDGESFTSLTLDASTVSGGASFSLSGGTCQADTTVLDGGQDCTVEVEFAPTVLGNAGGALNVESDAGEVNAGLAGQGTDIASLSVDPASFDFESVQIGDSAGAAFVLTNDGGAASSLTLQTLTANGAEFSIVGGTCAVGTVLGTADDCTVNVEFAPSSSGAVDGTLEVLSDAGQVQAQLAGTGIPEIDLRISGTASSEPVIAGTDVVYTLTVDNLSSVGDATGVVVEATLPSGTSLVGSTGCAEAQAVPVCTIGTLAAGDSVDVTLTVSVPSDMSGDDLQLSAAVGADQDDPDPGNNSITITSNLALQSDFTVVIEPVTEFIPATDDQVQFIVLVDNIGPSDVSEATVASELGDGLTDIEWSCEAGSAGICIDDSGSGDIAALVDMEAGGSAIFTVTARLADPSFDQDIVSSAIVVGPENATDPQLDNNEDDAVIRTGVFADGFESPSVP